MRPARPPLFLCHAMYNSSTSTRWGVCLGPPFTILPPLRGGVGVFLPFIYISSTSTRWTGVPDLHLQFFHLYEVGCVFGTPIYNSSTSTKWTGVSAIHLQFFHPYEVGCVFWTPIYNSSTSTRWAVVPDFHVQFFHPYEVGSVGDICDDVRRPSSIVEQDVNVLGWL